MKYMQNGGFQNHPLMKLTIALCLLFLGGFWLTNFMLYFSKMGLTMTSVQEYYMGSETHFTMPRSYQSMLEVTHSHLPVMAVVILLLTHLVIFAPIKPFLKVALILTAFLSALLNEGASWLVRFVSPSFAILKIASFLTFQGMLALLIVSLAWFLWSSPTRPRSHDHKKKRRPDGHPPEGHRPPNIALER